MGDIIEIVSNLLVTPEKLKVWCDATGDHLVRTERDMGVFVAHVQVVGGGLGCNAKTYRST